MNKAVLKHKIEKFVSDNISKIRKLHHNEFSTRKLKVNYINRTRGKSKAKQKKNGCHYHSWIKSVSTRFILLLVD
jgi:hypothetical protein